MGWRIVTIALIVGLVAGCTSDVAKPSPSPTPATRPTTTADSSPSSPAPGRTGPLTTGPNVRPGEKPPVYPDLAKQHTADGAIAFAGYFYHAYDWGYATNDAYLLAHIGAGSCSACRRYVRGIRAIRAQPGAVLVGGRVRLSSASIFHGVLDIDADYAIDVVFSESAVVLRDASGTPRTLAPAVTHYHSLVFVSWRHRAWTVVEVTDK